MIIYVLLIWIDQSPDLRINFFDISLLNHIIRHVYRLFVHSNKGMWKDEIFLSMQCLRLSDRDVLHRTKMMSFRSSLITISWRDVGMIGSLEAMCHWCKYKKVSLGICSCQPTRKRSKNDQLAVLSKEYETWYQRTLVKTPARPFPLWLVGVYVCCMSTIYIFNVRNWDVSQRDVSPWNLVSFWCRILKRLPLPSSVRCERFYTKWNDTPWFGNDITKRLFSGSCLTELSS